VAACAQATPVPPAADATAAPKATDAPKDTEPTAVPAATGYQGKIEMYAQSFTPTSALENPDPKAPKYTALDVLAREWEELHPGVEMGFYVFTGDDYWGWLSTQLIGGTGPDMFWIATPAQYVDEGKVLPLNDYLEMPNKYDGSGAKSWKDTFRSPFETAFSLKMLYAGIPLDLVATGVYCNVDMFKEVGIDLKTEIDPMLGSPKDWSTLFEWCKKFKDAGYFAFSLGGYIVNFWLEAVLMPQIFWSLTPDFDVLNYHDTVPMRSQEKQVSQEEFIMKYVCDKWDAFSDEHTKEVFRIIKDFSLYFPPGFADSDQMWTHMEYFLTNRLAMLWDGSWAVGTILQDTTRQFEFTSIWMPPMDKVTSSYAPDPQILPWGVGGYGAHNMGVHPDTLRRGNTDECIDWLMYITTPENNAMVVNEVPSFIPSNKQAKSLPEVENLFVGESRIADSTNGWPVPLYWFGSVGSKYPDTYRRELQLYLLEEQSQDNFLSNIRAAADEAVPEVIRESAKQYSDAGSWDLTRWTCEPVI